MSAHNRKHHAKRRLDQLIRRTATSLDCHREYFWRLIHTIRAASQLLVPTNCQGPFHSQDNERFVSACARLARYESEWIREPEGWSAPAAGLFVQFRSLVNYLFARYAVPNLMARIWLHDRDQEWERQLYLHLARGFSVRQFAMPFAWQPGKAAARFFMQAPDDLYPVLALRWAHVRSLGGSERLARILLTTVLGTPSDDEPFWETVIQFLIRHDPLSAEAVQTIVRCIHEQKCWTANREPGEGLQPLRRQFSIKHQSLQSLHRVMTRWRVEAAARASPAAPTVSKSAWPATWIRPFRHQTSDEIWTIHELLTEQDLRAEGGIMQHCAATYIHVCARRKTSLWSMQAQQGQTRRHVLTIEVLPDTRTIRQAKGKRNSPPSQVAKVMLDHWAAREGLRFIGTN